MNKNGSIGVFDSGIGGITVLKEIIKVLPNENYFYYSDSKNNPYGDKNDNEVINICDNIVKELINNNCKVIVIACNTASAKATKYLRNKYSNIPIIAIEPAYKMVHDFAPNKTTLIMATKGTIESEKFNLLLKKYNNNKTYIHSCIGLADLIEQGNIREIEEYLEKNLGEYKDKVENVVLGCTHYPLIKDKIENVLGKISFFDGAPKLAIHLKDVLEEKQLLNEEGLGKIAFKDSNGLRIKEKRFYDILNNNEIKL